MDKIKADNFTIKSMKLWLEKMTQKCIQPIMIENLLLET